MYIPRWIPHQIQLSESIPPVTVLTGTRQTGKSTLLASESMFSDYAYTTLDDLDTRERAHRNPASFVDAADKLIIDDEAKLAGEVSTDDAKHVQWLIEKDPACTSGIVIYGGSAIRHLTRHIAAVPWAML